MCMDLVAGSQISEIDISNRLEGNGVNWLNPIPRPQHQSVKTLIKFC